MTTDVLDQVFDRFATTGPEFAGGLSNHGPMAAEALVALGRAEAVAPWSEWYARRLLEHPESRNPIVPADWREALGDIGRTGDWVVFFRRELADHPWPVVLETWVARLTPGIMAAATHGIIRTGHAVRALDAAGTPQRLHELAEALAYWGARYQELPTNERRPAQPASRVGDALASVRRLDAPARRAGLIFDAVKALDDESFGDVINHVAPPADVDAFVTDLTRTFVRQYLANADHASISFIHSVTAPSALRMLAPHLSDGTLRAAMRYAWQACASLYAVYGRVARDAVPRVEEHVEFRGEDLIDRAVAARDEHAIKFTEACLREYRIKRDPAFIAAAEDAVTRLRR